MSRGRPAAPALAAAAVAAALLAPGPAPAAPSGDAVFGRWVVEDGRAVIEIAPCGDEACGHLVWLESPWDADGNPKRDVNNPDGAARARPLCGMRIISGLTPADGGAWTGGSIYSARDGKSFGFEVAPDGADRLTARGFVGISLLGRSQTWTREGGARGTCTAIGRAGADR